MRCNAAGAAAAAHQVVQAFERLGWSVARRRGSHIILTKTGSSATLSVPGHALVARGTLRSLLSRAGLSIETFVAEVR